MHCLICCLIFSYSISFRTPARITIDANTDAEPSPGQNIIAKTDVSNKQVHYDPSSPVMVKAILVKESEELDSNDNSLCGKDVGDNVVFETPYRKKDLYPLSCDESKEQSSGPILESEVLNSMSFEGDLVASNSNCTVADNGSPSDLNSAIYQKISHAEDETSGNFSNTNLMHTIFSPKQMKVVSGSMCSNENESMLEVEVMDQMCSPIVLHDKAPKELRKSIPLQQSPLASLEDSKNVSGEVSDKQDGSMLEVEVMDQICSPFVASPENSVIEFKKSLSLHKSLVSKTDTREKEKESVTNELTHSNITEKSNSSSVKNMSHENQSISPVAPGAEEKVGAWLLQHGTQQFTLSSQDPEVQYADTQLLQEDGTPMPSQEAKTMREELYKRIPELASSYKESSPSKGQYSQDNSSSKNEDALSPSTKVAFRKGDFNNSNGKYDSVSSAQQLDAILIASQTDTSIQSKDQDSNISYETELKAMKEVNTVSDCTAQEDERRASSFGEKLFVSETIDHFPNEASTPSNAFFHAEFNENANMESPLDVSQFSRRLNLESNPETTPGIQEIVIKESDDDNSNLSVDNEKDFIVISEESKNDDKSEEEMSYSRPGENSARRGIRKSIIGRKSVGSKRRSIYSAKTIEETDEEDNDDDFVSCDGKDFI